VKATIEVKDRKEADAIRVGLADPVMRAQVVILGTLSQLPSDRARTRVLAFVQDSLNEQQQDGAK
jgi:hypothetical protein